MSTIKTINTSQFYTGPKGDNYIISEIKSNIEELEKDLDLKENSPNPVGSLVMISYGDVEGTNEYNTNLKKDQSAGYFDLNSTLWLKQILTDEEINNSEQAIISSDNWCYILQTSLRGKAGKALNFVGSFNIELGKENEEGKWWNTKFLEGSGENGITDADFLKALKEKYSSDLNNLQFADTVVGNFNLYKDGVGEESEKIYMVVYYIRNQNDLPENNTIDNCFILNKISGVYTPPKNIISIEGFSFDTESNKILIGQVSKNNISNTKNNQILIGNNLDLSSAPEGAIVLGQYNSQTNNTLFAIGDGSSNAGNSNLIEIIKEKDSSNLNKEIYELKLKGNTVFSTKEENLNLAEKVEKISNIPFIKDLLDENFQGSDNAVFVSNGYWREINNNQQEFLTASRFEKTGEGTYNIYDLSKVQVEHFVPSQPINPKLYCPSGIKKVQCKISDSTNTIDKTFTNNDTEKFSEFQVDYFSDSDEKNIYPHRIYNIEFLVTLYKEGQKYYNNEIQIKFNINNYDFRNSKNSENQYVLPVIFLSFGQEIFSTRPNLSWALSPSSIEDFISNKNYQKGDKFKYNNNYYIMTSSRSFNTAEEALSSNIVILINSIYDLNTDWEEPNLEYYYPRNSLIYYEEKFLYCDYKGAYPNYTDRWFTIDEGVNAKKEAWFLIDQVVNHSPTLWNFIKNKFWKIGDIRDDVIIVDFDFDDKYNENFSPIPSLEAESSNFNTLPSGLTKASMTLLILEPSKSNLSLNTNQSYNIDGYYNQNFTPALRMDNNNDYNFNDLAKPVVKATKGKRAVEDGEKITTPIYSVHKYFTFSEVELLGEIPFSIPGETGKDKGQYNLFKNKKYLEILTENVYFTRSPYKYYGSWIAFSNKAETPQSFKLPYGDEKLDNTILDVDNYNRISPAPAVYWMFCI